MGTLLGKLKTWMEIRLFLRYDLKSSPVALKGFGIELSKTSLFCLFIFYLSLQY